MTSLSEYGITFNGHHSSEFGLMVGAGKEIGFPAKRKLTIDVPFSNAPIDLSGIYGQQPFEERTIKIAFEIKDRKNLSKEGMYRKWTQVVNWLAEPTGKVALHDDIMPAYHYLAEMVAAPTFEEFLYIGILTVTFTCYPFRIHDLSAGNDIWDKFDFDNDIAQETEFDVVGFKTAIMINPGQWVHPTIKADSDFTVTIGSTTYQIKSGTTNSPDLTMPPGVQNVTITGTGHIEIIFYQEVI